MEPHRYPSIAYPAARGGKKGSRRMFTCGCGLDYSIRRRKGARSFAVPSGNPDFLSLLKPAAKSNGLGWTIKTSQTGPRCGTLVWSIARRQMQGDPMKAILAAVGLAATLAAAGEAGAQLFGTRTLGTSLARRTRGAGAVATTGSNVVGSVRLNERYIRGNRGRVDFVGGDSQEQRGFVGSEQAQAGGAIRSAVSDLRIESAPDANRGQARTTPPRTGMYGPRLRVDFAFSPQSPAALSTVLAGQLRECPAIRRSGPIEVSVEGETATLRGEVASERDRTLARLIVLFEPGISQVRNELTVRASSRAAVGGRRAGRIGSSGPREF